MLPRRKWLELLVLAAVTYLIGGGAQAQKATPTLETTPGGPVAVGSGVPLSDMATLSGGVSPTGTITFELFDSSLTVLGTDTVPVSGDGTYSDHLSFIPPSPGTYIWEDTYSGDGLNNGVVALSETQIVVPGTAPEPPSVALLGLGLAGLAYSRRKKLK